MDDGEHRDQIGWFVDRIDHDIGSFDEFSRPLDQTRPADVRKAGAGKPIDARTYAPDQLGRGPWAILRNLLEDALEIGRSRLVDYDLHSPSK